MLSHVSTQCLLVSAGILVWGFGARAEVVIETVPVGNLRNADDTHHDGYGRVDYLYKIAKFEVTAGQYAEYLNAVAAEDTHGVYNTNMWSSVYGCKIERTGSSPNYSYSVGTEWADRPVNHVSWGDAARFANWMHNGQPTGTQDLSTTEDGSYYLNSATTIAELMAVVREVDATWVIPSEDEWHKAGHHYNDGVTGNYYDYATGTDTVPDNGNPEGDTGNSATFYDGDYTIGGPYYRTETGFFELSASPYGTFDQGGNVSEWNEAVLDDSSRGVRGGSFGGRVGHLHPSNRPNLEPAAERYEIGFRIAEVSGAGPYAPIVMETVGVGNGGNPDDTYDAGYGGVDYAYRMGKYEVTAGQYTAFLNAVGATDTYGLYHTSMADPTGDSGCNIQRSREAPNYTYLVMPDWADRPVNFVNWGDAARFANWMHNDQPTGAQDLTTTEDGSYLLDGAITDAELLAAVRKPDATWVIPSEDEWYKAAYHYIDGVTDNYYDFPTSSDSLPSNDLIDPDPGNNANFYQGGYAIGSPYIRTQVGEFENSASPYGTFDQGGNVCEWNEAIWVGSSRGLRGGSFTSLEGSLHAVSRNEHVAHPTFEYSFVGFRVADVSETGPYAPIVMETVGVGHPGNADDVHEAGYGGVDYVYRIGKYEVTAGQYTAFLNAVAAEDTYRLYFPAMANPSGQWGCNIQRSGESPNFSYYVAPDWADRPVNYVDWGDAARFVNWMHNGQPTGAQDLATTEDGSYSLDGAITDAELRAIVREPDATWVIPSEDEWYKAAYHYNDGVTDNYYDFPTSSDTLPSNDLIDPDPGNNANFEQDGYTIGSPYIRTQVGKFENSESPYGTFDQGGNVQEFTETLNHWLRSVLGGSFDWASFLLRAAVRNGLFPTHFAADLGFRVAEVSEHAAVVIETVTVGNPGNPGDTRYPGGGVPSFGGVGYEYQIGKFEVTGGQYAEFLNAVAATDTYGLYNVSMAQAFYGCEIRRIGSPGEYTYVVDADGDDVEDADWVNRPVNFISWGDAARFANWLHNGQPLGRQGPGTTEDGSYALNGATTAAELDLVSRSPYATWVIPTEDEWYKAAYHLNNGGGNAALRLADYVDYPTGTNTQPTAEVPPGADMTNGSANYVDGGFVDRTYYRTEVGAYDAKPSDSAWGTFDQGGNVWEWTEKRWPHSQRSIRGGSFYNPINTLHASFVNSQSEANELAVIGLRVAGVSEPDCTHDGDGDGDIDLYDFALYQATVADARCYVLFHMAFNGPR